jgi:GNAT superfamily N-acetyltransferase
MSRYAIELAKPGDGEAICRVTADTWVDTYPNEDHGITAEMIRRNQYQPDGSLRDDFIDLTEGALNVNGSERAIYVAKKLGEIVGVASLAPVGDRCKLRTLFVTPSQQGNGIGPELLKQVLSWRPSKETFLNVATYNQRAITLYERFGFKIAGPIAPEDSITFYNGIRLPEYVMVRPSMQKQQTDF